jgi:aspartate-semialdehyde dehydrogenase
MKGQLVECMNLKVSVAVMGATGAVGQKFIKLLEGHPWFGSRRGGGVGADTNVTAKQFREADLLFGSSAR